MAAGTLSELFFFPNMTGGSVQRLGRLGSFWVGCRRLVGAALRQEGRLGRDLQSQWNPHLHDARLPTLSAFCAFAKQKGGSKSNAAASWILQCLAGMLEKCSCYLLQPYPGGQHSHWNKCSCASHQLKVQVKSCVVGCGHEWHDKRNV